MEEGFDEIAKQCAIQLDLYQRCVLANQQTHQEACTQQRLALARCAESAVPLLQKVKARCASKINAYDRCLAAHQNDSDQVLQDACGPALVEVWRCTEQVKDEEGASAAAGNGASKGQ